MATCQAFPGSTKCVFTVYIVVSTYLTFLQHADNAQQAFSSDQASTLHLAIPALEALYRAWSSRAERPKYELFVAALKAACTKIDEYYEKTTDSPAYIMAMSMYALLFSTIPTNVILSPQPTRETWIF